MTRAVVASACLTTFVRASCVIRKSEVSRSAGRSHASRKIDLNATFGPPQLLQPATETLERGNRGRTRRARQGGARRQAPDALQRASGRLPQHRRCMMRLGKRCRSFDRREAKEDAGERGARLVVQLPRDPAALALLGRKDRFDRLTRHAFREM